MFKKLLVLFVAVFLVSTTALCQSTSNKTKGQTVNFLSFGFHVGDNAFTWRPQLQLGSYLSDHISWMIGVGYYMGSSDFKTVTNAGNPTTKKMRVNTLTIPLSLGYTIGDPNTMLNMQINAGVSYDYIMSMTLGGDKYDMNGIDRGGFCGHVRLSIFSLLFLEYGFPFNNGDGALYYGIGWNF